MASNIIHSWKLAPRNARLLLFGLLVSSIGNGMHTIAIGKALYDLTGSVSPFAWIMALDYLITICCQSLVGPLVDRGQPKNICLRTDVLRGIFLVIFGALTFSYQAVWLYFMMVVGLHLASQFYRNAIFSLIGEALPEEFQLSYGGLSHVALQVGQILGVACVGGLLLFIPPGGIFIIDGITFLISGLTIYLLQGTRGNILAAGNRTTRGTVSRFLEEWRDFFSTLSNNRGLLGHLFLTSSDLISVSLVNLTLVPLVAQRFSGDSIFLSLHDGAFAAGALLAAAFAMAFATERLSPYFAFAQGFCFLLLAYLNHAAYSVTLFGMIGFLNTLSISFIFARLQQRTRQEWKGKLTSLRLGILSIISVLSLQLASYGFTKSLNSGLQTAAILLFLFGFLSVLARYRYQQHLFGAPGLQHS